MGWSKCMWEAAVYSLSPVLYQIYHSNHFVLSCQSLHGRLKRKKKVYSSKVLLSKYVIWMSAATRWTSWKGTKNLWQLKIFTFLHLMRVRKKFPWTWFSRCQSLLGGWCWASTSHCVQQGNLLLYSMFKLLCQTAWNLPCGKNHLRSDLAHQVDFWRYGCRRRSFIFHKGQCVFLSAKSELLSMTRFQSGCSGEKLKFLSKLLPPKQD